MDPLEDITRLLHAAGAGRPGALDEAFASVYPRLRRLARGRRKGLAAQETLNTTALIHEAYLKVRGRTDSPFRDREHFFATAARAMRHVLINHAEAKRAAKRGGGARDVTLNESELPGAEPALELLDLDLALTRLEALNPRHARAVECLFFAGYTIEETAGALAVSPATVKRDWTMAKAWLLREMRGDAAAARDEN